MSRRPPRSPLFFYYILFRFFFNDTATTEIYTLSLHDALPIWALAHPLRHRRLRGLGAAQSAGAAARRAAAGHSASHDRRVGHGKRRGRAERRALAPPDRKSTRLNSSHDQISYAVFCLKKKNTE